MTARVGLPDGPPRRSSIGGLETLPLVPSLSAGTLLLASLLLLVLARPGLVGFAAETARHSWIADHPLQWRMAWGVVGVAMVGLGAFFVWWGARLRWRTGVGPALSLVACALTLDLMGLAVLVFADPAAAAALQSLGNVITVGLATPLYSVCFLLFLRLSPQPSRLSAWLARFHAGCSGLAVVALALGWEIGLGVGLAGVFSATPALVVCVGSQLGAIGRSDRSRGTRAPADGGGPR